MRVFETWGGPREYVKSSYSLLEWTFDFMVSQESHTSISLGAAIFHFRFSSSFAFEKSREDVHRKSVSKHSDTFDTSTCIPVLHSPLPSPDLHVYQSVFMSMPKRRRDIKFVIFKVASHIIHA